MASRWTRVRRGWWRLFGGMAHALGVNHAGAGSSPEQRRGIIEEQIAALEEEMGDLKRGIALDVDQGGDAVSFPVRQRLIRSRDLRYKAGLLRAELRRSFPESDHASGANGGASDPCGDSPCASLEPGAECLTCLADRSPEVRRCAANILGLRESSDVAPALAVLLRDEEVEVRIAAARALGNLRAEQTVCMLIRALKNEEVSVRAAAKSALVMTLSMPLDIDVNLEPADLVPSIETLLRWWSDARVMGEQKRGRRPDETTLKS